MPYSVAFVVPRPSLVWSEASSRVTFPNYGAGVVAGQIPDTTRNYFECGSLDDLVNAAKCSPDLYLVGGSPFYSDLAFEGPPTLYASNVLRELDPHTPQVLYGNLSTLYPRYLEKAQVELVFRGELEASICSLLAVASSGGSDALRASAPAYRPSEAA